MTAASIKSSTTASRRSSIGASGMSSSTRSVVTKSFLAGQQGGFDAKGDADSSIQQILRTSSSRPGSTAALLSSLMSGNKENPTENATEKDDDVKRVCGCCSCWDGIPVTNNTKALFVMMFMFAAISLGQYFAAAAVGSQALKADVISMAMDALSYLGNILGESARYPAQRIVTQLFFSLLSVFLLLYFNTTTFIESVGMIHVDGDDEDESAPASEGIVVITFAGLGLVFDFVCLYAYYYFAKKDAEAEYQAMLEHKVNTVKEEDEEEAEEVKISKPEINMLSALLHVSADLFRSTSTFVLGILMVSGVLTDAQQNQGDAILAVIIGCTIYIAGVYALYEWFLAFRKWFAALKDVDVEETEAKITDLVL